MNSKLTLFVIYGGYGHGLCCVSMEVGGQGRKMGMLGKGGELVNHFCKKIYRKLLSYISQKM